MTLTQRLCILPILVALASTPVGGQTNGLRWNVRQAGAAGDGQADCTAVFQKVLDEAGTAGGGVVEVPAGRYRINTGLSVPANVTLSGTYRVPPTLHHGPNGSLSGSVLLAFAGRGATNGPPFIRLAGNNSAITGLVITYPEWKQSDVPPVPYPPCVLSEHTDNVGVSDCLLLNPYEGIKLVGAARHWIRGITGYPIKRGIYVDECYDIGHIENVHFWPFGVAYDPVNPFCKWVNTEGVAFELARTDWQYVFNTFCFGYGVGYKFSGSAQGSANGNFLGLGADSCQRAVVVEQAQPPGLLICNGEFVGRWSSTDAVCLRAPTSSARSRDYCRIIQSRSWPKARSRRRLRPSTKAGTFNKRPELQYHWPAQYNTSVETNRCPASPLNAQRRFGSILCAPPSLSAAVGHLGR